MASKRTYNKKGGARKPKRKQRAPKRNVTTSLTYTKKRPLLEPKDKKIFVAAMKAYKQNKMKYLLSDPKKLNKDYAVMLKVAKKLTRRLAQMAQTVYKVAKKIWKICDQENGADCYDWTMKVDGKNYTWYNSTILAEINRKNGIFVKKALKIAFVKFNYSQMEKLYNEPIITIRKNAKIFFKIETKKSKNKETFKDSKYLSMATDNYKQNIFGTVGRVLRKDRISYDVKNKKFTFKKRSGIPQTQQKTTKQDIQETEKEQETSIELQNVTNDEKEDKILEDIKEQTIPAISKKYTVMRFSKAPNNPFAQGSNIVMFYPDSGVSTAQTITETEYYTNEDSVLKKYSYVSKNKYQGQTSGGKAAFVTRGLKLKQK